MHVDGAFGLWAAASPRYAHLTRGVELADSWGTDAHKWLNVPYDSGLAFCRDADAHAAAMSYSAAYLTGSGGTDHVLGDVTPESSRRARGFAVWAALRSSGAAASRTWSTGAAPMPRRMADLLTAGGATVHNEVVLNQVLVGFGDLSTDRRGRGGGAARRHLLAGRHDLAGQAPDPGLGVELDHDRVGHRPLGRGHPARGGWPGVANMQDVLIAAIPPIVAALLAAAGFWLRRRSYAQSSERAAADARSRIAVITSVLDAYRSDPTHDHDAEQQQLMKDLGEAYRQMYAVEAAAKRDRSGWGMAPLARAVLLLDRRPATTTAGVVQALYYLSLAWVLLWLAAAVLFGSAIAFTETQESFAVRLATSLGFTVLALAIGLAPALVLYLVVRMSGAASSQPGQDGPGAPQGG